MQKTIKNYLYTLLTVVLTGGFFASFSPTYGVNILPIDTALQQAYLRSQGDDFSSLTKSLSQGGNIYDSAYKLAKKNSLGAVVDTFNNVAENLNAQHECSLTSSDIANIAVGDASINASLAGLAGRQTFAVSGEAMVKSCVRIVQCAKGGGATNLSASALTQNYTQETYPLCRQIIQTAFTNTISIVSRQNTLDAANHGDDIFYNGSLDDSPFDLLKDIQLIGDILFKSNTPAPQVILYNYPGSSNGGGVTFFNPTGNSSPNLAITTNGGGGSNSSINNGNNSFGTTVNAGNTLNNTVSAGSNIKPVVTSTQGTTTVGGIKNSAQSSNQALQQLSAYHQTIQAASTSNNTAATQAQTTSAGSNGSALVCTTVTTGSSTSTQTQVMANQVAEATSLENALSQYNTAINAPDALNNALQSPEMQQNTSFITSISNLGNSSANGNGSSNGSNPNDPNEAANSCVSKCDPLAPADKAVCVAKCLCGSQYSKNGIFGISVCTVPTSQAEVIGGKSVKTVEEIVDEINNVLTSLKNSGQLMKHTPTKEFLDTSLSKIKLNKILSFDMNVAFKPIYDSEFNKEKKEAKKSQEQANADLARMGTYQEGNVGQERNKYIVLRNPEIEQQNNSNLATNNSPAPSAHIEPGLPYNLAKTLNNDMLDTISSFIQQNGTLWQQVSETLNALNTTSDNLKKKIEKGK